jgi:GTP cyclohydrolase I
MMEDKKQTIDPAALEDAIGDSHETFSTETPLREDAFELTDDEKIIKIQKHIRGIMETLGLDLKDDS